jgi:hypothetical protein
MKCEGNDKSDITNEIKRNEINIGQNIINEKRWSRICPTCKKELIYNKKGIRDKAIKNKRRCLSCSIVDKNKKRKLSDLTKLKLKEICNKNSFRKIGKKSWNAGKTHSIETKQKIRVGILNYIKRNGVNAPRYNLTACKFFDVLNERNGWCLKHALNGGEIEILGYYVDSYDEIRNIVVEYDEPRHYNVVGELKKKDIDRMIEICNHLKCEFWRYDEKKGTLKKYEY